MTDIEVEAVALQQAADEMAAILHDRILARARDMGEMTPVTIAAAIVELALTTAWRAHKSLVGTDPKLAQSYADLLNRHAEAAMRYASHSE